MQPDQPASQAASWRRGLSGSLASHSASLPAVAGDGPPTGWG